MAYFHQRRRRWRWRQIPNPMVTLYYAELFPLIRIRTRIPVWRLFPMVTVPILGTDLRPNKPVYTKFSCICLHVFPFLILHSTNLCPMLQVWLSTSVVLCHQLIIIEIHLYYAHLYKTIYPLLYKNHFINDISFQNVHFSTLAACESP